MRHINFIRFIACASVAARFLVNFEVSRAAPPSSAAYTVSCGNSTIQGTMMGGGVSYMNGSPLPWIWMEYWDGTGNATWTELDSYGTSNSGWFTGTQTYSVSQNCVAVDNYRYNPPGHPFIYFVNPDGTGLNYVNELAYGNVAADTAVRVTKANLMGPPPAVAICNAATMRGTYVTSSLETIGSNVQARLTRRSFDGAGNLTYREDIEPAGGGTVTRMAGTGTYSVSSTCQVRISHSLSGQSTVVNQALISPDGSAYWWVNVMNTGVYAAGKAIRVSMNSVNNATLSP